jgi:hypothetical protein
MTSTAKSPARFTQGQLAKALKATKAAGLPVSRVEIDPDGRLRILIGDGERAAEAPQTPFDLWKEKQRNARPA